MLVVATLVACGDLVRPAAAPRPEATSPSEKSASPASPGATAAPTKPPNVLVIETDDMRWDDLRWMPSVRRLIQGRGLSFENSFAPYPLCCPSRSSFLSGQYAHNHHVYTHLEPYGFAAFHDRHTIATVLQGAGYHTALVGKYLNGYGEQYLRSGKSSLHYVPPGWDQWYAGSDHLWDFDDPNYGGGTYSYNHLVQNINGEIQSFPGRYSTDVVAEQARGVITGFGKSKAPWFVWWTPTAPHHGLPVEPDDPRPRGVATASSASGTPPGGRTGSRGGSTSHPARVGHAAAGTAEADVTTSRSTCASCPSSAGGEGRGDGGDPAARGVALRPRRADPPDDRPPPQARPAQAHDHHVHLRQRLLPG